MNGRCGVRAIDRARNGLTAGFKAGFKAMRLAALPATMLAVLAGTLNTQLAYGDDGAAVRREEDIKAGYLFNFIKFVEWPLSPADVLVVCFAGDQRLHQALIDTIDNKRIGARRMIVRRQTQSESAKGCSVLYLDTRAAKNKRPYPDESNEPILTVSDAQEFTRNGGIIQLFVSNNRLRFSINLENARSAGLRISSSLLQLATAVEHGSSRTPSRP